MPTPATRSAAPLRGKSCGRSWRSARALRKRWSAPSGWTARRSGKRTSRAGVTRRRHRQHRAPKRGESALGCLRKRNRRAGRRQREIGGRFGGESYFGFATTRAASPRCLRRWFQTRSQSRLWQMIRTFAGRSPSKSAQRRPRCGLRRSNRIAAACCIFSRAMTELLRWRVNSSTKSWASHP